MSHAPFGVLAIPRHYHFQLGNGINGDLTNDFKFQFGEEFQRAA